MPNQNFSPDVFPDQPVNRHRWWHQFRPTLRELGWLLFGIVGCTIFSILLWTRLQTSPDRLHDFLMENPQYLADNPDVLAAARAVLQGRILKSQGTERAVLIQSKWAKFTNPAFSPSVGNPDARMTLIEFTDYTCAPCKASAEAVKNALANNKDLRVVLMILPIGGSNAEFAARVAFAAYQQDPIKFWELHSLLMAEKGELTEADILRRVSQVGLDVEQIRREVRNTENWSYLDQVRTFAQDLQVVGVPAFVLGQQLVFGGMTTVKLSELIRSERARIDSSNSRVAEVR